MRKTALTAVMLGCLCRLASAQNEFVNFTNPQFPTIPTLITDSLVVENSNSIRHIGQAFDSKERLIRFRDTTFNTDQTLASVLLGNIVHTPLKLVQLTQNKRLSPFPSESTERLTIDSLSDGKIEKITFELWNGTNWFITQITHHTYDAAGQLTEMWSENWDFQSMSLIKSYANLYTYDSKGNKTKYQTATWDVTNNTWIVNNEYVYTYDLAGHKLSETWNNLQNNVLKPVQLATYRYDATGRLDSIKYYDAFTTAPWRYYSYVLLDDSPEQQITQKGRQFEVNAQGAFVPTTTTTYVAGPKVYSTLFSQELTQRYDAVSQAFVNSERYQSDFSLLPDGRVKGLFIREQFTNGSWNTIYKVQGWLRKPGSVSTHSPQTSRINPCGLPNPLTSDILDEKLRTLSGVVSMWSVDGRAIGSSAPPGFYWIMVTDKGQARCAQLIQVH